LKKKYVAILALIALAAAPQEVRIVIVRTARVYTMAGEPVERGMIRIENGRIAEVGTVMDIPPGATVIDASSEVVIPGLIDGHTSLADGGRDAEESISQDVRAIDGYDFYQSSWRQLSGGVTTVYVTPGSQRLVSGVGAIVKTAGRGPRERTLAAMHGLRVTLGEVPKNPPSLFAPPTRASADRPLTPAKRQYPSTRMGEFAELRRATTTPGPLKDRSQPVMVAARSADDLVKAILFAEEAKLQVVLLGAEEAPLLADLLAERKIPVIFNSSYAPGRREYAESPLEPSGSLEGAGVLAKAKVKFALQAPDDGGLKDLLFIAAAAVRSGLSEREALASITIAPAEILGVADRVGSIVRGKDADLVFLAGDPLAPASAIRRVMVDGEFVFERKASDVQTYRAVRDTSGKGKELLAIKNARILTVTQGVIPEGLIFAENGKISYVGRGRPIPGHAKVIDGTGLTVVPGFIDLDSRLGFHLDRTEAAVHRGRAATAPATLNIAPSILVRTDDPEYRTASESGVTGILLAPDSSGVCSVVKLSGERNAVVREAAAIKFSVQGGTAAYVALKEQLTRAKKYADEWDAYDRVKKEPAKPAAEPPKPGDAISGTWKGTIEVLQATPGEFVLELKLEGTKVTGTFHVEKVAGAPVEPMEGTFDKGELVLQRVQGAVKTELTLKLVEADHLKGTWKTTGPNGEIRGMIECRREVVAPKVDVKEPRKDEALEPYRKLFAKEIPALVEARDLPAMENAAKALRTDFGLDTVMVGAADSAFGSDLLFERGASVAVGPDFLVERRGAVINAAEALASQGVTIGFASSAASGTRHLPLSAAYAVRHGLDPFDALKALTISPARMLKLDARLGSIERGRDADLVLFSGDPFAMTSRIRYVIIDGRIVHESK
jgi:imidazolonepropionase-like amidohydrolase